MIGQFPVVCMCARWLVVQQLHGCVQLKPSLNLTCQLKSVSNHTLPVVRLLLPASSLHKPSDQLLGGRGFMGGKFKISVRLNWTFFFSFVYFFTNKTKTDPNHKGHADYIPSTKNNKGPANRQQTFALCKMFNSRTIWQKFEIHI